ncbi:hypothetical protein GCM10022255_093650 [Dactylosporangium darangshiense]|uniref:Uncharacterized protein n=1 Tax=Dactylosporangium darangshiense TaxID=579108 RepID=A0ABP8DPT1_9ACTN
MRVLVNLTRPGVRAVHFSPSDVFRMHGDEALTYDPEPDDGFRQECHRLTTMPGSTVTWATG